MMNPAHEHEHTETPKTDGSGPSDDLRRLWKYELTESVRQSVEKSLKARYTWLGIIVVAMTGGGILAVINQSSNRIDVELAGTKAIVAEKTKAIDKSLATIERVERRAEEANVKLGSVQTNLASVEEALALHASALAQAMSENVAEQERVDELEAVQVALTESIENLRSASSDLRDRIEKLLENPGGGDGPQARSREDADADADAYASAGTDDRYSDSGE